MLVIRLTRIGKTNEPAYRIVVAEKANAVKGSHMEVLGFYNPSENKKLEVKKDRFEYWVSQGAQPSDTMACMMKAQGVQGMDKFIGSRNLKRRATKAPAEVAEAPAPQEAAAQEAPAEEVAAQ